MSVYYFFSEYDKNEGFIDDIANNLKVDLLGRTSIMFVSAMYHTDYYSEIILNWFKKIDIVFDEIFILDEKTNSLDAKRMINNASCMYLMGGYPLEQIEYLKKNGLIETIHNSQAVIMGESAGAINMCKHSIYTKDSDHDKTMFYDGIGLVDITVEPHFILTNIELLNDELIPLSYQHCIYGICDKSAVIMKNLKAIYSGNVYKISNGIVQFQPVE